MLDDCPFEKQPGKNRAAPHPTGPAGPATFSREGRRDANCAPPRFRCGADQAQPGVGWNMPSRTPNLALARAFRRAPPATERMLWKLLRDRRLEGLKFRRQVPLGRYIADFVCLSCKLIVEADGPWH